MSKRLTAEQARVRCAAIEALERTQGKEFNSTSEEQCLRVYAFEDGVKWADKYNNARFRIIRNHWQNWAFEQLTAFAIHLQKRGAFRDDLCMDFEHEAQSFIEMQNNKEL